MLHAASRDLSIEGVPRLQTIMLRIPTTVTVKLLRLDEEGFAAACCETPDRVACACPSCAQRWSVCLSCGERLAWRQWRFEPIPSETPRTCPQCQRTVPPQFADQIFLTERREASFLGHALADDPHDEPVRTDRRVVIKFIDQHCESQGIPPRISRVQLSKSKRTVHWGERVFRVVGSGYKYNHVDLETGAKVWISGPRRDGFDTLYPGVVHVDEDVREAYWTEIRKQPERINQVTYRSPGLYTKRKRGKKD